MATSFDLNEFRKKIFEGNSDLGAIVTRSPRCGHAVVNCFLSNAGLEAATSDTRFAKVVNTAQDLVREGILPDVQNPPSWNRQYKYDYSVNDMMTSGSTMKDRIFGFIADGKYKHESDVLVDGLRVAVFRDTTAYL